MRSPPLLPSSSLPPSTTSPRKSKSSTALSLFSRSRQSSTSTLPPSLPHSDAPPPPTMPTYSLPPTLPTKPFELNLDTLSLDSHSLLSSSSSSFSDEEDASRGSGMQSRSPQQTQVGGRGEVVDPSLRYSLALLDSQFASLEEFASLPRSGTVGGFGTGALSAGGGGGGRAGDDASEQSHSSSQEEEELAQRRGSEEGNNSGNETEMEMESDGDLEGQVGGATTTKGTTRAKAASLSQFQLPQSPRILEEDGDGGMNGFFGKDMLWNALGLDPEVEEESLQSTTLTSTPQLSPSTSPLKESTSPILPIISTTTLSPSSSELEHLTKHSPSSSSSSASSEDEFDISDFPSFSDLATFAASTSTPDVSPSKQLVKDNLTKDNNRSSNLLSFPIPPSDPPTPSLGSIERMGSSADVVDEKEGGGALFERLAQLAQFDREGGKGSAFHGLGLFDSSDMTTTPPMIVQRTKEIIEDTPPPPTQSQSQEQEEESRKSEESFNFDDQELSLSTNSSGSHATTSSSVLSSSSSFAGLAPSSANTSFGTSTTGKFTPSSDDMAFTPSSSSNGSNRRFSTLPTSLPPHADSLPALPPSISSSSTSSFSIPTSVPITTATSGGGGGGGTSTTSPSARATIAELIKARPLPEIFRMRSFPSSSDGGGGGVGLGSPLNLDGGGTFEATTGRVEEEKEVEGVKVTKTVERKEEVGQEEDVEETTPKRVLVPVVPAASTTTTTSPTSTTPNRARRLSFSILRRKKSEPVLPATTTTTTSSPGTTTTTTKESPRTPYKIVKRSISTPRLSLSNSNSKVTSPPIPPLPTSPSTHMNKLSRRSSFGFLSSSTSSPDVSTGPISSPKSSSSPNLTNTNTNTNTNKNRFSIYLPHFGNGGKVVPPVPSIPSSLVISNPVPIVGGKGGEKVPMSAPATMTSFNLREKKREDEEEGDGETTLRIERGAVEEEVEEEEGMEDMVSAGESSPSTVAFPSTPASTTAVGEEGGSEVVRDVGVATEEEEEDEVAIFVGDKVQPQHHHHHFTSPSDTTDESSVSLSSSSSPSPTTPGSTIEECLSLAAFIKSSPSSSLQNGVADDEGIVKRPTRSSSYFATTTNQVFPSGSSTPSSREGSRPTSPFGGGQQPFVVPDVMAFAVRIPKSETNETLTQALRDRMSLGGEEGSVEKETKEEEEVGDGDGDGSSGEGSESEEDDISEDDQPLGTIPGALTAQKSLRLSTRRKKTTTTTSGATRKTSSSSMPMIRGHSAPSPRTDPFEFDKIVEQDETESSSLPSTPPVPPIVTNITTKSPTTISNAPFGHSLLPQTDDAVERRSAALVRSPSAPLEPLVANSSLTIDSPPMTSTLLQPLVVTSSADPIVTPRPAREASPRRPALFINTVASTPLPPPTIRSPGLAPPRPSPPGSNSTRRPSLHHTASSSHEMKRQGSNTSSNSASSLSARAIEMNRQPSSSSSSTSTAPPPTAGPKVEHRIFIIDHTKHIMVSVSPLAVCGEIVEGARKQGALNGYGTDSEGGFAVWEICRGLGVERPIREYELLADVVKSWDHDSNILIIRRTPLWPLLSSHLRAHPQVPHSGFAQLCGKKNKWSKRFVELKDGTISHSKSEKGKDSTQLCSLSTFEVFFVARHIIDQLKAPKPYVFALKSKLPRAHFEDVADYCFFLSVKTPEELNSWIKRLVEGRNSFVRSQSSGSTPSTSTSGTSTPTSSSAHLFSRPSTNTAPLLARNPSSRPVPAILASSLPPSLSPSSGLKSPTTTNVGGVLSTRPHPSVWAGMSEVEKQKWLRGAQKEAREQGKTLLDFGGGATMENGGAR